MRRVLLAQCIALQNDALSTSNLYRPSESGKVEKILSQQESYVLKTRCADQISLTMYADISINLSLQTFAQVFFTTKYAKLELIFVVLVGYMVNYYFRLCQFKVKYPTRTQPKIKMS